MPLFLPSRRLHAGRPFLMIAIAVACSAFSFAQGKPNKADRRELKREMIADATDFKPGKRDVAADRSIGRPGPEDAQSRMLSRLREQMEITDDAEWDLIGERIAKVGELRRSAAGSLPGPRGGSPVPDKSKRSGGSGQPEQDALRAAVAEKMPDAEIKMRLARMHEVHQQNEARLVKAQEELRAVLSVRQEAVAVMVGLLPP